MREEIQSKINEIAFMNTSDIDKLKRAIAVSDIEKDERAALVDAINARETDIESLKDKFANNGEIKAEELWQ